MEYRKKLTTKYFIPCLKDRKVENVPVCKKLFINNLSVSRDRVQLLCKRLLQTGDATAEQRGGDRKSKIYSERKQAVKTCIESIQGSNQAAPAVYHRLTSTDLSSYHTVKLVADGCGGQNKNKIMIGMLRKFLSQDAPSSAKEIKVIFPVVGHSFIPPDRIFGHIKSEVKKHSTLLTDKDYINIIGSHATIIRLRKDCPVLEWKEAVSLVVKEPAVVRTGVITIEEESQQSQPAGIVSSDVTNVTHHHNNNNSNTKLEQSAELCEWTDNEKLAVAKLRVSGEAQDFALSHRECREATTYEALKQELVKHFKRKNTTSDTKVRPRGRPRKTPLVPEDASKSHGGPSSGSRFDASQPRPVTMENQHARRKEVTNPPTSSEHLSHWYNLRKRKANLLLPSVEGRTPASSRIEDHVDHEVRGVGYIAILGRMTHFNDNYKVWAVGSTAAMDRTTDFN
uniref:DUF7869 domain-containing protein n=1 Tax=Timema douglasi TaxID=61478 RepID=A0A7R8VNV5_TIMDO|nr:unnamed protein product [Timema douglasi]